MERAAWDGVGSDNLPFGEASEGLKVDVEIPSDVRAQDAEGLEQQHPRLLGNRFLRSTHALSKSLKQVLPGRQLSRTGIQGTEDCDDEEHSVRRRSAFFVDVDAMKAKVKANLSTQKTTTLDLYKTEGLPQRIARSPAFDRVALVVIACNAAWITVDTDYNDAALLIDAHPAFQVVEHFFCFFFVVELAIRFLAFSCKRDCLRDAWFLFDSTLVLTMVAETWVMTFVVLVFGGSGTNLGDTPFLRVARLLRLSRMGRMARLLRAFPELMIMVKGMLAAMRSVLLTLALLLIIMYIFGIIFTQLTAKTPIGDKFFRSVSFSMYTLAMHGTLLDNVRYLADSLSNESFMLAGLFFVFILLAAFTVMNMLIGVLCEVVSAVAATEKEEFLLGYVKGKMMSIVEQLDTDGDRHISKTEFAGILENAQACRALRDVGVDVMGLVDCAENIFLDSTGARVDSLSFHDFMDVVLQLRGTNNATVKDVMELRKMIRVTNNETTAMLAKLNKRIREGSLLGQSSSSSAHTAHSRSSWAHPERHDETEPIEDEDEEEERHYGHPWASQPTTEHLSLEGRWHPFGAETPTKRSSSPATLGWRPACSAQASASSSSQCSALGRKSGPAVVGWRPRDGPSGVAGPSQQQRHTCDGTLGGALGASQAELQAQLDGLNKALNKSIEEVLRLRARLLDQPDSGPAEQGPEARQVKFSGTEAEAAFATGVDIASCVSFKVGSAPGRSERASAPGIDVAHTVSFKAWAP